MKIVRRTRVAIRTEERVLIRRNEDAPKSWCADCGADVRWLSPDQAALVASVGAPVLEQWTDQGRLHLGATPGGPLLICLNSLICQIREFAHYKEKTP